MYIDCYIVLRARSRALGSSELQMEAKGWNENRSARCGQEDRAKEKNKVEGDPELEGTHLVGNLTNRAHFFWRAPSKARNRFCRAPRFT